MGKKDLAAFLIKLSTDARLRASYMADPNGTTAAAGLSAADRAALRGASAATLEDYLGEEPAAIVKTPIVKGAAAATRIVKRPIVKKPIVKKPIVKTAVKKKAAKTSIVKTSIVKTPIVKSAVKTTIVKTPIVKTTKTAIVKTTKPGKGKPKK